MAVATEVSDTINLLRECNSGIKMGVATINEIMDYVSSEKLKEVLYRCKEKHERLDEDTKKLLKKYDEGGKEPNMMAKGMSWMKTNIMMSLKPTDSAAADIFTDGCNMGIKSLRKYLNEYEEAQEDVRDIAKRLISLEEDALVDVKEFL